MPRSSVSYKWLFVVLSVLCFCLFVSVTDRAFSQSSSAESNFNNLLDRFKRENIIPSVSGTKKYIGNITDEWAQIGWYQWQMIGNANRFVFSANVTWDSASLTPNNFESGCGVLFHNSSAGHLLASLRMDGLLYFTGIRNGQYLSYGTYKYDRPSIEGSRNFVMVVNNDQVAVYLNGERFVRKANLPVMGDGIALTTLSGTNMGFGTRCEWKDVYLYTW